MEEGGREGGEGGTKKATTQHEQSTQLFRTRYTKARDAELENMCDDRL